MYFLSVKLFFLFFLTAALCVICEPFTCGLFLLLSVWCLTLVLHQAGLPKTVVSVFPAVGLQLETV